MMKRPIAKSRSTGLTLVELMIAMTLGLIIVAVVGTLYLGSSRSFRQDERVSAMGDELRFALDRLSRDIEMAGFWGGMITPGDIASAPGFDDFENAVTDCGNAVLLDPATPVQALNDASAAQVSALFACIAQNEVQPQTAAISIVRVGGTRLAQPDLVEGRPYLQTLGDSGALFIAQQDGQAPNLVGPPEDATYWQYQPVVYYIRSYSVDPGDAVPSLCRKRLVPSGNNRLAPTTDCLAIGVQDLHFEFGFDTNADGTSNFFASDPAADDTERLAMLRVHLLGRSERRDGSYRNVKSFQLGDKVIEATDDRFYRRTASASVALRNPVAQRLVQ